MANPPHQLVLETSSSCQLRCPECWIGKRDTGRAGQMSFPLFHKIAYEAQGFIKHTYLHLWGEPTLNRHLPEMIDRIHEFSTIDLATHGLSLTEKMANALAKCESLSISMDGITQEVYEKYRVGGRLDEAMRGMRLLIDRVGSRLNWTFVVFKSNEHQIDLARQLAHELGVNIGFKAPVFWTKANMDGEMPSNEIYRRYYMVDGKWYLKADMRQCREFWNTIYVLPTGDVITCCYDGAAQYVMGNITNRSLLDIWNDKPYQTMRDNHISGNINEMCIKHCNLSN